MRSITAALVILTSLPALAVCRTWRVEKDGGGDFTVIQDAVDAAAPGDTIQIGAGRYTEYAPFTVPGWTEDVYVAITTDDLTLIGAGQDVTIIGPEAPIHVPTASPKGIFGISYVSDLAVEGLTVENVRDGVYRSAGGLDFSHCTVRNCDTAMLTWTDGGMTVTECSFLDNEMSGVVTFGPAQSVVVSNCYFANDRANLEFDNGTHAAIAQDCMFAGGVGGVSVSVYSDATIADCHFENLTNFGIDVGIASSAHLVGNTILPGAWWSLHVDGNCAVTGTGNSFGGGDSSTLEIHVSAVALHGNHILNGGGYSVRDLCCIGNPEDWQVDLTNNYWGTTNADQIAQWIWDHNDDPGLAGVVLFEPFAGQPLPSEGRTWGAVKDLYRPAK